MTDSTILQPEGLEQRYERYKEKIKHFTIMNDIFMRNVLKEISCTEYILQVIMNRTGLKVIDQTLQKDYKNLQGRSAILDCVAKDAENNHFNVEIQGENDGAFRSVDCVGYFVEVAVVYDLCRFYGGDG